MDDVLVHDTGENNHLEHLKLIFQKMSEAGMKVKVSKCAFSERHLQYLGHLILCEDKNLLKEQVKTMLELKPPEM